MLVIGDDQGIQRIVRAALGRNPYESPRKSSSSIAFSIIRPDINPAVVAGLGIDPDVPLSKDKINGLLAGRGMDGEKIRGKQYGGIKQKAVDPKTGARELTLPIGSYDFCPTPDKSVSVAHAFASPAEKERQCFQPSAIANPAQIPGIPRYQADEGRGQPLA